MPPSLALLLWFVLLCWLLRYDGTTESGKSRALWVPLVWIFITGSRLPSQWLGVQRGELATALEDGSSFDRLIFFVLILMAVGILMSRSFKWGDLFAHHFALIALLLFGL